MYWFVQIIPPTISLLNQSNRPKFCRKKVFEISRYYALPSWLARPVLWEDPYQVWHGESPALPYLFLGAWIGFIRWNEGLLDEHICHMRDIQNSWKALVSILRSILLLVARFCLTNGFGQVSSNGTRDCLTNWSAVLSMSTALLTSCSVYSRTCTLVQSLLPNASIFTNYFQCLVVLQLFYLHQRFQYFGRILARFDHLFFGQVQSIHNSLLHVLLNF